MIRRPRPNEIKLLPQIENEADQHFARVGLGQVCRMPTVSPRLLERAPRDGRLWAAVSPLGRPVGFALLLLRGEVALLDQLSVLPRWQRHGYGAELIAHAAEAARRRGFRSLHLSTYLDVPWNAPYYAGRGFRAVPRGGQSRGLRALLLIEIRMGHPPWRRVIMRQNV
jgi:GNAT superfamily N-acetyltransferase